MKKLLFIFAAAALLVACNNKENEPTAPTQDTPTEKKDTTVVIEKNHVYEQFKTVLPLQGAALTSVQTALTSAGWTNYEATVIYYKYENNTYSELTLYPNASDVVNEITLSVEPDKTATSYKATMGVDYVKDIVNKIGGSCVMGAGSIDCRYLCAYKAYSRFTQSYTEFLRDFNQGNLNQVCVYYLDSSIQSWVKSEDETKQEPFTGVSIRYVELESNPTSTVEYKVVFDFTDEKAAK